MLSSSSTRCKGMDDSLTPELIRYRHCLIVQSLVHEMNRDELTTLLWSLDPAQLAFVGYEAKCIQAERARPITREIVTREYPITEEVEVAS